MNRMALEGAFDLTAVEYLDTRCLCQMSLQEYGADLDTLCVCSVWTCTITGREMGIEMKRLIFNIAMTKCLVIVLCSHRSRASQGVIFNKNTVFFIIMASMQQLRPSRLGYKHCLRAVAAEISLPVVF